MPLPSSFFTSRLSPALPSTIAGPESPPRSIPWSVASRRFSWPSSAPWHRTQLSSRIGATSKAKDTSPFLSGSTFFSVGAGRMPAFAAGTPSKAAVGFVPSKTAPASIQEVSIARSSFDTLPPPRGMSPDSITSTIRLELPWPFCTMPVFMRAS